jgi:class 3 adenylate cyclase
VASRLTSLAKPGEILISKRTYELIDREKSNLEIEERGKVSVKGRKTQIDVFNVLSLEKD